MLWLICRHAVKTCLHWGERHGVILGTCNLSAADSSEDAHSNLGKKPQTNKPQTKLYASTCLEGRGSQGITNYSKRMSGMGSEEDGGRMRLCKGGALLWAAGG